MRRKGSVNIINMTISEAIQQLADLRDDRESFINNDDPENDHIYLSDMAAIDVAVATMAKYEMSIFYSGVQKGLDIAEDIFLCSNYEADESEGER